MITEEFNFDKMYSEWEIAWLLPIIIMIFAPSIVIWSVNSFKQKWFRVVNEKRSIEVNNNGNRSDKNGVVVLVDKESAEQQLRFII